MKGGLLSMWNKYQIFNDALFNFLSEYEDILDKKDDMRSEDYLRAIEDLKFSFMSDIDSMYSDLYDCVVSDMRIEISTIECLDEVY